VEGEELVGLEREAQGSEGRGWAEEDG